MSKEAMKQMVEALEDINSLLTTMTGATFTKLEVAVKAGRQAIAEAEKQEQKQEPKPFGYTLEETMKCWDLGYAAAVKALAKKEQPYADKAASVSNNLIKIDPVTGNVQIGTSKQEQDVDWKDMYEKEKRRSAMWIAKYEKDIGQLERATPQQEQSVSVSNPIGEFPKTILAVIKEVANRNPKNGLDRWTDYETGAYMQDDADAALLWIKNKAKKEQSVSVGEPVGEMQLSAIYEGMVVPVVSVELPVGTKLYTTPYVPTGRQQRKPLTDNEICNMVARISDVRNPYIQFARAIEAAHGITSATDFKE